MDINIRQGETLEIAVTVDDLTADTVELIVTDPNDVIIIDETENFATVDGKRVATITSNDTNYPVAEYEYMLVITYSDGFIQKLPDGDCEDCGLPVINICKSLGAGIS